MPGSDPPATLFDEDLAARVALLSDPDVDTEGQRHGAAGDTERAAAWRVMPRTGTQRRKVLEAFASAENGYTDHELSEATHLYLYSAAPRRNELTVGGWLRDSGQRRTTPLGSPAIVWVLTDEGRVRLAADAVHHTSH